MEREGVSPPAPDAVPFTVEPPGTESSMSRSWPRPPARTGAETLNAGEGLLLLLFETLLGTETDALADGRAGAGVRNMVVAARKEAEEDAAELGTGLANTVTNTVCVLACVSCALVETAAAADVDCEVADVE